MALLPSRAGRAHVFFASLVFAVSFAGSGACNGRTACLQYSQGEYAANGNACLSPSAALTSFTDPSCPSPIVSVDGPGSYDGILCCYPVTYDSITPDCGGSGVAGAGGAIVNPGETVGFAESGIAATATVSATSSSSGGPCVTSCSLAVTNGGVPCPSGAPSQAYGQLLFCGCGGIDAGLQCSGPCVSFCAQNPISSTVDSNCLGCLTSACSSQLTDCENN